MMDVVSSLWHWLTGRSPGKTATPVAPPIQPPPPGPPGWPGCGVPVQPREHSIEIASMEGLLNELRYEESRYRGPDGEIIHHCHGRRHILAGCGHPITMDEGDTGSKQDHCRQFGGLCVYCLHEYQPLVESGQMHPLEAERRSMVCSACAQMTISGHLSCPKHRKAVVGPGGTTQYIDAETAKNMARKDTVGKAVNALAWLFGTSQQPESKKEQKQ